jgi:hypothetical protein
MSELMLLSAAGVRVLLDLHDRLATEGAWVVLAAAPYCVRRILSVLGLDSRLLMAPTVEEAVDSVSSGAVAQPGPIRVGMTVGSCRAAARRSPSVRESGTGLPRSLRS